MVAKPVIVGAVGVIVLASALVLNYFVLPGDERESATAVVPQRPPVSAAPKPGENPAKPPLPSATAAKPATASGAAGASVVAPPAAKPPASVEPSFDVVRVDPDGNTVLAGRGAPNAEIAIMDGGEELGRVTADGRGEWVFIPPSKLPPGQRVLFLRQSGAGQTAATGEVSDSVILVIPEKGRDIAGRPASEPSVPLVVVVPKDDAAEGGKAVARVLQAPTAGPLAGAADGAGTAGPPGAAGTTGAATTPAATSPAATQAAGAAPGSAQVTGAASGTSAQPNVSQAGVSQPGVSRAPVGEAAGSLAATATATAGSAGAAAGVAAPGVTAPGAPTPGSTTAPDGSRPVADAAPSVSAYPEKPADTAAATPDKVAVDVIDYDAKGDVVFSGRTDPGARVEVFIDDKKVGDTGADAAGRWTMRPEQPVAPGSYQLRVDKVAASGTVEARVAFPFVRANPLTELPNNRLVVIQPGNNLWRIATRVYGTGVRYVEIFDANKDQILNPDLIYPGQVFGLPRTN